MFAMFDPLYWLLIGPTMLFALWAQMSVKSSFARYSRVAGSSGLTGAQAAGYMLRASGLHSVGIERATGFLSDHYDPSKKVLRLSPDVHDGRSVAALGVACHEAGHALQDAAGYAPLKFRTAIVPTASIGSWLAFPLIILGVILNSLNLAAVGVVLFSAVVVFQIITLPVEFNASNRAKQALLQLNMISPGAEAKGVGAVLNAAAMTYVAATVAALAQLLYFVLILMGNRR